MIEIYRDFERWFIGDYMADTLDIFEKSKIRIIFRFSLVSILSILINLPLMFSTQKGAFVVTSIAFLFMCCIPFLLKATQSIKITGSVILSLCFFSLVNIYFLLNRPDPMGVGAWFIAIIIIASFTLGKRWGFFFLSLSAITIIALVFCQINGIPIYHLDYNFSPLENGKGLIGTPIRAMLPVGIIYFVILDFLKAKNATDFKMQEMLADQQALNERIRTSETKYRKFIEDADDLIYMLDGFGRFTYVNPAFERVGGFNLEELKDKGFNFFVKEEYKPLLHKALYEQVKEQKELSYHEFPILNKDKGERWIGQKINMTFQEKGLVKVICIGRDITHVKITERALIKAKEEAIKASEAKADFLSSMSHEIRTPMNAVIGMTHLLLQENPREDQYENLNTLKFSGENLLMIISDILDFSKIESGKLTLEKTSFSLSYLVDSIHHALSSKAVDNNIKLLNNYDSTIPDFIIGDSVRLYQILNNLIGNALKFTKEGHVIIQTTLRRIEKEEVSIDFSIIDTGIGILKKKVNLIFDNFTQASSSTTREFGGTGLGLSITKKLLELQGSEIKVSSVFGKGSHFYFSLTFKKSYQKKLPENNRSKSVHQSVETSLKGLSILLVEDNKVNQLVARKFISKWGADLKIAENGVQAIAMVEKGQFDLVLMDLQMPVMGGMEATQKIRSLGGKYKNLPIIALTASTVLEVQDNAIKAGMDDFITKPFDPKLLYSKIKAHIVSLPIAIVAKNP
ncbi:MAG: PAS domain S-box-containing protein [Saprospiraceae bacterium]|jgi:PAS domain S-box-containing protein